MWWNFSWDFAAATFEAQHVIALRMVKLAKGGHAAQKETHQMINEKISASLEAAGTLASGGSPEKVLRRYRTIMRANAKRLAAQRKA